MTGRILITGATGFLGGALLRALKGQPVLAQGRNLEKLAALNVPTLHWDMTTPLPITRALAGVSAIIHCAALSAPFGRRKDFYDANVTGTAHVIDLAQNLGLRRLVHISSPSVLFAPRDQLDLDETAPLPRPYTHYAGSKAEAERLVLKAKDLSAVILRPRGLYGSGDTTLLPRLMQMAQTRPIPLFREGKGRIDLTHVDDAASACLAALRAGPEVSGEIFHISGGQSLPITEIAARTCAHMNVRLRWREMPLAPALWAAHLAETLAHLRRSGEPKITRYGTALLAYAQSLNISKAERLLGWTPSISFDEGLKRTLGPRQ